MLFDLKQDDHYSLFLRTISHFLLASVPDFIPNHVKLFSVDYSQSFFFKFDKFKELGGFNTKKTVLIFCTLSFVFTGKRSQWMSNSDDVKKIKPN